MIKPFTCKGSGRGGILIKYGICSFGFLFYSWTSFVCDIGLLQGLLSDHKLQPRHRNSTHSLVLTIDILVKMSGNNLKIIEKARSFFELSITN